MKNVSLAINSNGYPTFNAHGMKLMNRTRSFWWRSISAIAASLLWIDKATKSNNLLLNILTNLQYVVHLDLYSFRKLQAATYPKIIECCPHLQSVRPPDNEITSDCTYLLERNIDLHVHESIECAPSSTAYFDKVVTRNAWSISSLHAIRPKGSIQKLSSHLSGIQQVFLKGDRDQYIEGGELTRSLAVNATLLTSLEVKYIDFGDDDLQTLFSKASKLIHLKIEKCYVSEMALQVCAKNCTRLKTFHCTADVPEVTVRQLIESCTELAELDARTSKFPTSLWPRLVRLATIWFVCV